MARPCLLVTLIAAIAVIASTEARADAGLPMLAVAWPAYIVGLIPVVLIEAFVGVRRIGLTWPTALRTATIANLWSTFLGIPIVWLLMLVAEFVIAFFIAGITMRLNLSSGWEDVLSPFIMVAWIAGDDPWTIYFAFVLLAIPFCVASIYIERRVALRCLPEMPATVVRAWVRDANIWSYTLLVVAAVAYPLALSGHAT